ncbi:uncharacterized protein [Venturia canescens]|uniref:uncharacterized protein n=1 Tax=Venturia canescens TaxID=32260 RepID=UPI001C9C0730|nr:uncharacterized protein LOC122412920 [Venturia canescens]
MLKYFKKLFENAIIQGQQLVGRNVQSAIDSEENENERETVDHVEPREAPRPARVKKPLSKFKGCTINCGKEIKKMRQEIRCCAQRISGAGSRKKSEQIIENRNKRKEEKYCLSDEKCQCENCSIVSSFNECGVCLESLQSRGIRSCPVCANIVCSSCTKKLVHCPFCRSAKPMQKNRAIERLLGGLFMPCKNARNGCRTMLNSEMRSEHEASCEYNSVECPISHTCCWSGSPTSMLAHLQKVHALKPLEDDGLTVEISNFRKKSMTSEGEYTIYLSCHGQLFAVKVTLYRKKLILSFSQIGFTTSARKIDGKKYGVWVKIRIAGKLIRGVLPFGKFDHETRQIEINCKTLCPEKSDSSDYDDSVKIEIFVREMRADNSK